MAYRLTTRAVSVPEIAGSRITSTLLGASSRSAIRSMGVPAQLRLDGGKPDGLIAIGVVAHLRQQAEFVDARRRQCGRRGQGLGVSDRRIRRPGKLDPSNRSTLPPATIPYSPIVTPACPPSSVAGSPHRRRGIRPDRQRRPIDIHRDRIRPDHPSPRIFHRQRHRVLPRLRGNGNCGCSVSVKVNAAEG